MTEKEILDLSAIMNVFQSGGYTVKDSYGRLPDDPDYVSEWTYTFSVWPSERDPRNKDALFSLFKIMGSFVAMEFTEQAFDDFRQELAECGLSLREISRHPYMHEEGVL